MDEESKYYLDLRRKINKLNLELKMFLLRDKQIHNSNQNISIRMMHNEPLNDMRLKDINFRLGIPIPLVHEYNCLH